MAKSGMHRFDYVPQHVVSTSAGPSTIVYRPMVTVTILGLRGEYSLVGLLDTGADDCILPIRLLSIIEPDIIRGRSASYRGFGGGEAAAIFGNVWLSLDVLADSVPPWPATVAFVQDREDAILGHTGFLEHFAASFNGPGRFVTLTYRPPKVPPKKR